MDRIIYHIEYAKNGDIAWSWWEICMLENIKYFLSKWERNIILTTNNGKKVFEKWWLLESELLQYNVIKTDDPRTYIKLLLNYFKRVFLAKKQINKIIINDNDIIYCHSDFFPNSIPMYFLSKKNNKSKLFFYFHMKYPSIFKWYIGEFIWKYSFPKLNMIYLKLNQLLYLKIIKKINRGTIISVNPYYWSYISKFFNNRKIKIYFLRIFWWINYKIIKNDKKVYDLAWLWRFHKQKWIDELFEIAKILKEQKENIKIVVIWWWWIDVENEFKENIKKYDLEGNILYEWFINWNKKFEILSQAKLFLMTSYFEWRPITIIEAMKLGLPVLSYDLPVYWVYDKWIIKVPLLDNQKIVEKIIKILDNEDFYKEKSNEALDFSKNYSWDETWREIYNLIK